MEVNVPNVAGRINNGPEYFVLESLNYRPKKCITAFAVVFRTAVNFYVFIAVTLCK